MKELATNAVDTLATEILILKQQTAQNLVEIGKRLILAKESLGHGEWLPWLEQKVEFSDQQARRLMKVAKECSNSTALLNLPPTKVFTLLELPAEEREEFLNTQHVVGSETKTVDEMTTRELQQVIKERDELQHKLDNAKNNAVQVSQELDKLREEKSDLQSSVSSTDRVLRETQATVKMLQDTLEEERKNAKSEVRKLTARLKEAKQDGTPDVRVQELEEELLTAQAEVQRLTEEMREPITLEAAVVEKIPVEIERELAELRQKAQELEAKSGRPDPVQAAILKYSVHFEVLVDGFKALLTDLSEIQDADAAAYEKYRNAVSVLIVKMQERL